MLYREITFYCDNITKNIICGKVALENVESVYVCKYDDAFQRLATVKCIKET